MKYIILFLALLVGCGQTQGQKDYIKQQREELVAKSTEVEVVVIDKYLDRYVYGHGANHPVESHLFYKIDYVDQSDLQIYSCTIKSTDMTGHEFARILNGNVYKFKVIKGDGGNTLVDWRE